MVGQVIFFALVALWVAFDTFVLVTRDGRQKLPVAERRSKFVMVGAILLGMFPPILLSPAAQQAWTQPFGALRWTGVVLMALGVLGRVLVVRWFGRSFTVEVRVPQALRTDGPYRYVRHPAYAAELVVLLGTALAFGHLHTAIPAFVVPTAGLFYRIHAEERVLHQRLGAAYGDYARRTKRLIPFLFLTR